MNRRTFIKRSALASSFALVPGFLKPLERWAPLADGRRLVVIQLSGGNDWLNTIVPYGDDLYYRYRPHLGLKNEQLLTLDKLTAMNTNLQPLKALYDNGEMAIVNGVGYPNPDRSHFRSMDIWQSASSSEEILHTGWLGRYLDSNCKNAYMAVETDNLLSLALQGKNLKGMAIKNIKELHRSTHTPFFHDLAVAAKEDTLNETNQGYLYKTLLETQSGIDYLYEKNKIASASSRDFPDTELGKQLRDIAGLILNGTATRIYYVSLSGFDTHASQLERQNNLLKQYAEAVAAFVAQLKAGNAWDDTLVFTFSEFGRRVEENASRGTDHGTAGNVLLFAKQLTKKGIVNPGPRLDLLDEGDLRYTVDFRSLYKNILQDWLGADANTIIPAGVNPFKVV